MTIHKVQYFIAILAVRAQTFFDIADRAAAAVHLLIFGAPEAEDAFAVYLVQTFHPFDERAGKAIAYKGSVEIFINERNHAFDYDIPRRSALGAEKSPIHPYWHHIQELYRNRGGGFLFIIWIFFG